MNKLFQAAEILTSNMIYNYIMKEVNKWINLEDALFLVPGAGEKQDLVVVEARGHVPDVLIFPELQTSLDSYPFVANYIIFDNEKLVYYQHLIKFQEGEHSYGYILYSGQTVEENNEFLEFTVQIGRLLKIKSAFDSLPGLKKTESKLKYQLSFFASAINNIFEPYSQNILVQMYMEIVSEMFLLPAAVTLKMEKNRLIPAYTKGITLKDCESLILKVQPFLTNSNLNTFPTVIDEVSPGQIGNENLEILVENKARLLIPLKPDKDIFFLIIGISSDNKKFTYQDKLNLLALNNTLNHALEINQIKSNLLKRNNKLDEKVYALEAVYHAAESIFSSRDIEDTLNITLDMLSELFHSNISAIILCNSLNNKFELVKVKSIYQKESNLELHLRAPTFMPRKKSVLIDYRNNAAERAEFLLLFPEFKAIEEKLKPVIIIQLFIENNYYGFITLSDQITGEQYDKEKKDLLILLVSSINLAIENVQIYEELRVEIENHEIAEKALRQSEEKFRKLTETAPALICVFQEEKLRYVNSIFEAVSGYSKEECMSLNPLALIHPEYRTLLKNRAIKRLKGEKTLSRYEAKFINKDGKEFWGEVSVDVFDFGKESAIIGVIYDISERKKSEETIRFLKFHDKLTGLYHRAFFEEEISRMDTRRQLPLSIIMADVNGLKFINDTFGNHEGDKILKKVAEILKASCREEDVIARLGGDEFAILLPQTTEEVCLKKCEQIKKFAHEVENAFLKLSISLGVASKVDVNEDLQKVFKEAEDRMYRNKLLESKSTRSVFINSLEKTLWERSHETEEHTRRVRTFAEKLGRAIDLPDSELDSLILLATLHDIGKIAIPNSILDKPDKLSDEEWEIIKKHPDTGYRIAISSPELVSIADGILSHHERWDGKGYPRGLKGEAIPILARILAIADSYDVMINERPYKKAFTQEEAINEIKRCSETQFDPELVEIFVELISKQKS